MDVREILSKEEIKDLTELSDFRGFLALFTTWAMICGSFAMVAYVPNVVTTLVALIILGGRHLALAILMHDCSHYTLFKTRWLNELVGRWFCSYPTWQDLRRYRQHHWDHHRKAGTLEDPDASLVKDFPVTRGGLLRKFLRDITGISGLRRVYGLLLMDFGFIRYTVASEVVWLDRKDMTFFKTLKLGLYNLHGVLITNFILWFCLWSLGHPNLFWLWVVSYLTTFSLFLRIRSIAEHAGTELHPDPRRHTRTTHANVLARLTVAPIRVNYHLEHHLVMTVPYFKLAKAHDLFRDRQFLDNAFLSPSYLQVLREISRSS
jgi:fatty acid desaturase